MDKRFLHVQRAHVVHSFEATLHVVHVVSHLLTPSLWTLVIRTVFLFQLSASPRDIDKSRTLRFWFTLVFLVNIAPLMVHLLWGVDSGEGAMLNFVGRTAKPDKLYIVLLDVVIISLQLLHVFIDYEAHLILHDLDLDPLLPLPSPTVDDLEASKPPPSSSLIMDVRFHHIWQRLRHPPSITMSAENDDSSHATPRRLGLTVPHPFSENPFRILPIAPSPPRIQRRSQQAANVHDLGDGRVPGDIHPP